MSVNDKINIKREIKTLEDIREQLFKITKRPDIPAEIKYQIEDKVIDYEINRRLIYLEEQYEDNKIGFTSGTIHK